MVITEKEFCDQIHILIHSARLLTNYKASELEKRISKLVIEKYSDSCRECKIRGEALKDEKPKSSFMSKLGGMLNAN